MGVEMNFGLITKNHAADPEIRLLTKSISKPYRRATAMPTAWEIMIPNWVVSRLFANIFHYIKHHLNLTTKE